MGTILRATLLLMFLVFMSFLAEAAIQAVGQPSAQSAQNECEVFDEIAFLRDPRTAAEFQRHGNDVRVLIAEVAARQEHDE